MAAFKLTIRNGPKVSREKHEDLGGAIAALERHTERIRAEGGLPEVSMIRTYDSASQVKARLEISTGGILRSHDAGIDVMGDGALVPFRGGVFRKALEPGEETAYQAVERALLEATG